MPASPTTRNRFKKPEVGAELNTWGDALNTSVIDLVDSAIDGWVTISSGGATTLTSTNYAADQSRMRLINYTAATAGVLTIPAVQKWYLVRAPSANVEITAGGTSVTVLAGDTSIVATDGSAVYKIQTNDFNSRNIANVLDPTLAQHAATKKYVDDTAFAGMSGTFPGQTGNAGKFLGTDGTTPAWSSPFPSQTGNAGEVLSTDGTNTLWLALGVALDVLTGTTATPVTGDALYDSAAPTVLTDAATVAWDTNNGYNAYVVLGGNRTIGAPTNLRSGMTYTLELVQDATGSRVPTWASVWDWGSAGAPTLQTTANKADKVVAQYNARTSKLDANFRRGA